MARLTKTYVDKAPLPPPKANGTANQTFHRDDALPGFALRITSGGAKSFIVERRINGKVKRMTLGRYGHLTVEQARSEAIKLLSEVAQGKDPIKEKRAKAARTVTLQEAFESYLASRKDLKPGTVKNYTKCINGCFSDWKTTRLLDISKDMVALRHRDLGKRAPQRANNAMRVLRAIFNHAIHVYEDASGNPLIPINPVTRLSQNREWYPTKRRQTLIKPHELAAWYAGTEAVDNTTTRDLLRLILFTGLRKTEAMTLRWADIDLKARTLTVTDTKNRDPHTLPLSDYLFDLLSARHAEAQSPWVFPSPYFDGPMAEPRTAVKKVIEVSGVPFTVHDLRRTFITIAESLDISAYALKRLVNHRVSQDVTAGYIIADVERLRIPMERVSAFLLTHIEHKD